MKNKAISAALILLVLSFLLFGLEFPESSKIDDWLKGIPYISLIEPPQEALAISYGTPLDTSNIGFLLYHYDSNGFTLASTVAAWQTYTDNSTFYDGTIRVDMESNSTTFSDSDGQTHYFDVYCRLRADGWVLIWLDLDNDDTKYLVHWGQDWDVGAEPTTTLWYWSGNTPAMENRTCLYRALERIYYAQDGDLDEVPATNEIYYYDYEHSSSTIWIYAGVGVCRDTNKGAGALNRTMYYTFPEGITVDFVAAQIYRGNRDGGNYHKLYFDGVEIISKSTRHDFSLDYQSVSSSYYSTGTQHSIITSGYGAVSNGPGCIVCVIMFWIST